MRKDKEIAREDENDVNGGPEEEEGNDSSPDMADLIGGAPGANGLRQVKAGKVESGHVRPAIKTSCQVKSDQVKEGFVKIMLGHQKRLYLRGKQYHSPGRGNLGSCNSHSVRNDGHILSRLVSDHGILLTCHDLDV